MTEYFLELETFLDSGSFGLLTDAEVSGVSKDSELKRESNDALSGPGGPQVAVSQQTSWHPQAKTPDDEAVANQQKTFDNSSQTQKALYDETININRTAPHESTKYLQYPKNPYVGSSSGRGIQEAAFDHGIQSIESSMRTQSEEELRASFSLLQEENNQHLTEGNPVTDVWRHIRQQHSDPLARRGIDCQQEIDEIKAENEKLKCTIAQLTANILRDDVWSRKHPVAIQSLRFLKADIDGTLTPFDQLSEAVQNAVKAWILTVKDADNWYTWMMHTQGRSCLANKRRCYLNLDPVKVTASCRSCTHCHNFCIRKRRQLPVLCHLDPVDRVEVTSDQVGYWVRPKCHKRKSKFSQRRYYGSRK